MDFITGHNSLYLKKGDNLYFSLSIALKVLVVIVPSTFLVAKRKQNEAEESYLLYFFIICDLSKELLVSEMVFVSGCRDILILRLDIYIGAI